VRRLLENGANSSFVNQIANEQISIEEIIADPLHELEHRPSRIPIPRHLYGEERLNSSGINLADVEARMQLEQALKHASSKRWQGRADCRWPHADRKGTSNTQPADHNDIAGEVVLADASAAEHALSAAFKSAPEWANTSASERAAMLDSAAELLEENRIELMSLIIREGGRTINDALNEVREAIDFCRYYAAQARQQFEHPSPCPASPARAISCDWLDAAYSSASVRGISPSPSSPARSLPRSPPATASSPNRRRPHPSAPPTSCACCRWPASPRRCCTFSPAAAARSA